jgi:hypothetical protein
VAQERKRQPVGAADALDATLGRGNDLLCGAAGDHARHQRSSTTRGVSQPRTRRSATGQATTLPDVCALLTWRLPPRANGGGPGIRLHP